MFDSIQYMYIYMYIVWCLYYINKLLYGPLLGDDAATCGTQLEGYNSYTLETLL